MGVFEGSANGRNNRSAARGARLAGAATLALGMLPVFGSVAWAATPARVAAIDDTARVALTGQVSPRLAAATDLGPAASDGQLALALHFTRSEAQQQALTALLAAQANPASPSFHRWLTPQEFGAQFGLAAADAARISAWLQAQGFAVDGLSADGQSLAFRGTVAQVQAAFGTELHRVLLHGAEHLANLSAPMLPAALANITTAITGLDNVSTSAQARSTQTSLPNSASTQGAMQPEFTSPLSGNHYIAPGDLYTIYDEAPALSANINGSGVGIAVLAQSNIHLGDIAAFRAAAGLSANAPKVAVYGGDPGYASAPDVTQAEMAVEWAGAAAPSASITVVDTTDVLNSLIAAVSNNVAPVIVDNYPQCEADLGASKIALYSGYLAQAAAQGMTVVAASGDAGASACDAGAASASNGLAVSFPASSPLVTAVGGTMFNDVSGNYWSTGNGSTGGSALGYIPEVVWNENTVAPLLASGGGASLYFPKPSWQTGTGVPQDSARDVPDVALQGSFTYEGHLICESGYCLNGFYSLTPSLDIAGGTEITAPEFAGFLALVVQKQGRIGVANNTLYALANSSYGAAVFHDIVAGNNAGPCITGTANCAGGALGFSATTGYDLATGLGSVDVFNLVNDWAQVTAAVTTPSGTTASITNLSGDATKVTAGVTVNLTATVASGASASTTQPTGNVQFTVDGTVIGSSALSGGSARFALSTTALTAGTHLVQASYSGDTTYAGSRGAFSVDINSATLPDFTLTPATTTVTVASGAIANGVTFTVTPINGFTGAVTFSATASSSLVATPAFNPTTVQITGTGSQSTTFTLLAYQGLAQEHLGLMAASRKPSWPAGGAVVLVAGLTIVFLPRRRRLGALLLTIVAVGSVSLTGCFGTGTTRSSGTSRTNTPPGTYTVTVVATGVANGASVSHSSTVTLVVQ